MPFGLAWTVDHFRYTSGKRGRGLLEECGKMTYVNSQCRICIVDQIKFGFPNWDYVSLCKKIKAVIFLTTGSMGSSCDPHRRKRKLKLFKSCGREVHLSL